MSIFDRSVASDFLYAASLSIDNAVSATAFFRSWGGFSPASFSPCAAIISRIAALAACAPFQRSSIDFADISPLVIASSILRSSKSACSISRVTDWRMCRTKSASPSPSLMSRNAVAVISISACFARLFLSGSTPVSS